MAQVMQTTCCTAHTHLTRLRIIARKSESSLTGLLSFWTLPEGGLSQREGGTLSSASTGGLAKLCFIFRAHHWQCWYKGDVDTIKQINKTTELPIQLKGLENVSIQFLSSSKSEKEKFLELLPDKFELSTCRIFYLNILLREIKTSL